MLEKNPFRYFILLEGGFVAFLATVLANHGKPSENQCTFWKTFAENCGLEGLSKTGPHYVEVEKFRIDLLVVWDQWAIMVEAKTKAEHVRDGQLRSYYDRLRSKFGKIEIIANVKSILIVFLTPATVGKEEFASLAVAPGDRKIHIGWEQILQSIESSFSKTSPDDSDDVWLYPIVTMGTQRIRELLKLPRFNNGVP